jgi:hypothetical protein
VVVSGQWPGTSRKILMMAEWRIAAFGPQPNQKIAGVFLLLYGLGLQRPKNFPAEKKSPWNPLSEI